MVDGPLCIMTVYHAYALRVGEALHKLAVFSWLLGRGRLDGTKHWTIAFWGRATKHATGHSLAAADEHESGCEATANGAHHAAFASGRAAGLAGVVAEGLLDDVAMCSPPLAPKGAMQPRRAMARGACAIITCG